jgi:ATP adenylyltransferase
VEQRPAGARLLLEPGTLWPRVFARSREALASGALVPLATRCERIEEGGIPFLVRVAAGADHKPRATSPGVSAGSAARLNPFLPYDEALFVAEVSRTHVALLNKFPVLEHHLLVVTRAYEEQQSRLTRDDFEALWACLREVDGLAFYNSGPEAGASQPHKHLQLVPAALGPGSPRPPVEPVLSAACFEGHLGTAPGLPFRHALARVHGLAEQDPGAAAEACCALYTELLSAVGALRGSGPPDPYNLLLTREWMLAVPRSLCAFEGLEVNALGFAGALFARSPAQLELLRRAGPLAVLRKVGLERGQP